MVAMYALKSRDTGLLRNSRLMGIPEFRCMANDVEMYRRSNVCSIGTPMKLNGTSAFQEKFYYILSDLLWRVCENYSEISQADFYKLYRWFHITRKLLRPPPPRPDYVSPFAKKEGPKQPTATIRMFTRTNPCYETLLFGEQDTMRSKVDPAKYLGSHVSLTDSIISSSLRLGSPLAARNGDALLQALSENDKAITVAEGAANWNGRNEGGTKSRTLGTTRNLEKPERSSTAPLQRRTVIPTNNSHSTSAEFLPNIGRSYSPLKNRSGYQDSSCEIDADVTIVDPDVVLDQGSELMLKLAGSPYPSTPRVATPPLPSVDVLSKRQLKLIGTHAPSPTTSCKAVSELIKCEVPSPVPAQRTAPPPSSITPSALFEMAGQVGERMMVNRARLLFLQHNANQTVEKCPKYQVKPITAPPDINRHTPLPSMQTMNDTSKPSAFTFERSTTAPVPSSRPSPVIKRRSSMKSSKLRSAAGTSQSVPGRSESRARESQLSDPFIVQGMTSLDPARSPCTVPPPSASTSSTTSYFTSDQGPVFELRSLERTPHRERCAIYKDPLQEALKYHTLEDEEDEITMSETPLLQLTQDNFSSLSSFLPSSTSLVI